MYCLDDITVIIVNYRTLDLTTRCVESLREHYPTVKVILIDNGSLDPSREYIRRMAANHQEIAGLLNPGNRFHGPALDQGLRACQTQLALTLDSDTEVIKGGFLEGMAAACADPEVYAVGRRVYMDWFGYETSAHTPLAFPSIHPSCMLLRRAIYLRLRPFIHHGSPGIRNMRQAWRAGYRLLDFPVHEYVIHKGRGTCSQYGYGLGLQHTIENLLHNALRRFYPLE
jgi:glycosyltransferase involved in cell wall biosynthesis